MRTVDLAYVIPPETLREALGIRPGEKLHEVLLTEEEARHSVEFDDCFVIEPEQSFKRRDPVGGGRPVPEGFRYTSDNNDRWLSKDELAEMLGER